MRIREGKLNTDIIEKLQSTDFSSKALDELNNAIDHALSINGLDGIIEDIMKKTSLRFGKESKIQEQFKNFLYDRSKEELSALNEYLTVGNSLHSIVETAQSIDIWKMKEYIKNDNLSNLFSDLYEQSINTGGRKNRGKGEILLSILMGANFSSDIDLSIGNEDIEVKAYGGRLDGNYTKAATISPAQSRDILKDALEKCTNKTFSDLKRLYATKEMPTGINNLFINSGNSSLNNHRIVLNTPETVNANVSFNLERKTSTILGLGIKNINEQWQELIEALDKLELSKEEIKDVILSYLRDFYLERFSDYKFNAIKTLLDKKLQDLSDEIINNNGLKAVSIVAEIELICYVEAATSNKINRKLQNLVLIGRTTTNDIYVLLIGFSKGNSLAANLATAVRDKKVKTVKFDSSNQGSNLGLKVAGTSR